VLQGSKGKIQQVIHLSCNHADLRKDYLAITKTIIAYILDALLPISVIMLTKLVLHGLISGNKESIYFQWCTDCLFFYLSFVFVQTYLRTFIMKE
jgi:hypothetical protein